MKPRRVMAALGTATSVILMLDLAAFGAIHPRSSLLRSGGTPRSQPPPVLATAAIHATSTTTATPVPTTVTSAPPPPPRILFSHSPPGTSHGPVMSVLPDGTGLQPAANPSVRVTQLSSSRGLQVYSKTISSTSHPYSGCGIAGCSSGYVGSTEAGIAVAQPDGSGERVLTSGGYDVDPSFSPDGDTIAYLRHQEGGHGATVDAVGLMSWDGVPLGALRPPDGWTYASPVWSPDGTSIAVERRSTSVPDEQAGGSAVMVLPLDGGPPRQVASGPFRDLAWSHGGRELAGVRTRYVRYGTRTAWQPGDHPTGDDVWVVPLDGSAPRNVTNLAPAQEPSTFCETNLSMVRASKPAWSPDDTHVAFLESATSDVSSGGVSDVGVVDSSGRHRVTVFSSPRPAHCDPRTGMSQAPRGEIVAVLGWS
ncbi:MAG: hypothetical protein E6G27_06075 [Actinobacteria bacterium]|nr:MAG: hypothetical protein E6G27_06075 [Actinomycetota bacterium]